MASEQASPELEGEAAMTDNAAKAVEPAALAPEASRNGSEIALLSLEERVQRLEGTVAGLQDTRQLEERIVERLHDRWSPGTAHAIRTDLEAPVAVPPVATPAAVDGPPPLAEPPRYHEPVRKPWLLWDAYAEARVMILMYVDPRYRLTLMTRILPLVLLALILTSWFWLPGTSVPVIGTLVDKVLDLVLAFLLFKVLSREARRYREVSPDLPEFLRH